MAHSVQGTLTSGHLAAQLHSLYKAQDGTQPQQTVVASVLDAPPPSATSAVAAAALADAAFAQWGLLQRLHLHAGSTAQLTVDGSFQQALVCNAPVLAAVSSPSATSSYEPGLGLSPLLAFNLGLLYQLHPFHAAPDSLASQQQGQPYQLSAYHVQVSEAAPHPAIGAAAAAPQSAGPCAKSVRIGKVAQPAISPLHQQSNGDSDASADQAAPSSPAYDGVANGSEDAAVPDLLEQLQAYFTAAPRCGKLDCLACIYTACAML